MLILEVEVDFDNKVSKLVLGVHKISDNELWKEVLSKNNKSRMEKTTAVQHLYYHAQHRVLQQN